MRNRAITLVLAASALVLALTAGMVTTAPVAAAATGLASTAQVITVSAPSSTSTYATVEAWARQADPIVSIGVGAAAYSPIPNR